MITLTTIPTPEKETGLTPVHFSDETMRQRKEAILSYMKKEQFDTLVIYADLEHGGNFEYLVGFLPRFEEALLILHQDGTAYMVMGNENLNKVGKARIKATAIHMPHFSLPNQPMNTELSVKEILAQCDLSHAKRIGLVGWKNFTSKHEDNRVLSDLPAYIVQACKKVCPTADFSNATYLFIGEHGARTINNANEFAHYEFGAALAGNCMLDALDALQEGVSEMEIAQKLDAYGQHHNVVTIMATGSRFEQANMYPSAKTVKKGDALSITTGYKGGLQSRGGYAITCEEELPKGQEDYLERVAKPYFQAVTTWLESIHVGMCGEDLYDTIEEILPKETYGWSLNPGHLCGDEEWLSSPIYPNSKEILKSGMLFQIDIIPSVSGYAGISCESGILLADEALRAAIKAEYPNLWKRIEQRRAYMIEELGIHISEEVLPTSIATAFCRPFLLNKTTAFRSNH